jgi:type VI secretion system protein ImpC
MADAKKNETAASSVTQSGGRELLDQMLTQMPKTVEKSRSEELIRVLVEAALQGTVRFDKSLAKTIGKAIGQIDAAMSKQLAAIMHHEKFQKLEGSWRGLHHLVMNSETATDLQIRVFNVGKRELFKDLEKATEFDQSTFFKKIYDAEFGMPGGEPYGAMIGDYEFTNHPEDIELLTKMSQVSAAAFCPFITAAGPELLGLDSYQDLAKPRDLAKEYLGTNYAKWRSFRDSEDSRFVVLTMPRTLARLPYGAANKTIDEFGYEELPLDSQGRSVKVDHAKYCWMNSAFVYGTTLTGAFAKTGWCTAIRGRENGGSVEGLPYHTFIDDDGDVAAKCPTEIGITDRRSAELSSLGFMPLGHYKNTDFAVFVNGQTAQKPKKYDDDAATANAKISTQIPYIMAASRIAHYLKCIARDKIGKFMDRQDCEDWLNRWIAEYVNPDEKAHDDIKARYPLMEAQIKVEEVPGSPGSYNAVAHLRPRTMMNELKTSLRMVAKIPRKA